MSTTATHAATALRDQHIARDGPVGIYSPHPFPVEGVQEDRSKSLIIIIRRIRLSNHRAQGCIMRPLARWQNIPRYSGKSVTVLRGHFDVQKVFEKKNWKVSV